ncbi:methyl-accepting chemotaxis sensory transducer [Solidesulfovibrio carbinoliphilus subsp. oakridgensis]|uniref:Methyl-accepting chemotaxis sensory transducer n=1 Tax=Solidesulfovibrio carbinoliphilus subsp. oakridgensis TaxID=694327 RepID=G7Q623_9BACT|nr:bacteriohemerythrin [Solidesulfovibrio carbinoliphilus]EHJ47039.1 methyl-accepting chemotaxis sensory transducer [Solidesulfovibrio carbinoliphilus subsp. oakridgensis]
MRIRTQILCSLGILFLLSCAMFATTWTLVSDQKADGEAIDLTALQRSMVHEIGKDSLARLRQAKAQGTASSVADEVRSRLGALERAQLVLITGGDYAIGQTRFHIPVPDRDTAALFQDAGHRFKEFAAVVETALTRDDAATADQIMASANAVAMALDKAVGRLQKDNEGDLERLMTVQAAGMALGAAVFIAVLALLGRTLTGPLARLGEYAAAVAGGNLKAVAAGGYPPELAELRDAMSRMVASLEKEMAEAREKGRACELQTAETQAALAAAREQESRTTELLDRMNEAAGKARSVSQSVMDESSNLLVQAEQVASGAQHQRDRMIETATAMEEMNSTVLEVARNAAAAAASADGAKGKALTGAEGVRSAVSSIETIRTRILDLKESMTRLGQQADNIGHIMNVISDIADQTNLLALNAAIEAARAGDAGRGFAVVADEVRKLAEKTMAATKEVGNAVVSIQGQARENIAAVESAASGIEESTRAAADSGRFMDEIVGIVDVTASQVASIATASEQQSATSEEINRAVEEVNRIANETADGMEVATAALAALSALSGELDEVIRQMTGDTTATRRVVPTPPRAVAASRAPVRAALPPSRPGAKSLAASRPAPAGSFSASRPAAKALPASRPAPARPAAPRPMSAKTPAAFGKPAAAKASGNGGAAACSIGGGILQWDQSLAVGIGEIDGQHQKLVGMICDLHEAMRSGKGKDQVEAILRELENYAVEHFGYEEKLMEQYKYPAYRNHRKEHEAFVDKVIAFGNDFRSNRAALTTEVMNFLKNWLVGHIKGTDQKYSAFFNERGVN